MTRLIISNLAYLGGAISAPPSRHRRRRRRSTFTEGRGIHAALARLIRALF
jgi:hypothetical protein